MRFLVFITISSLILGGLHYYVWIRLFRDPAWPPPWPRVGAIVMTVLAVSVPAGLILFRRVFSGGRALVVIPLVWLGAAFLLLIAVAGLDLARLLGRAAAAVVLFWQGNAGPEDPARRLAISRALAGTAALAAGGITAFAVREARGEIEMREVPVRLERLPAALDGLVLAQVSDLHVGLTIGRGFVASVAEKLAAARADAIVMTGDLVDGSVDDLAAMVEPLGRLSARFGVYFVPGNHDHYAGLRAWLPQIERLGMKPLMNARAVLGEGAASIDLAGIDDYTGRPNLDRALFGRDPERELVLLAHQPRAIAAAAAAGVGLQLSGHTHGGQIWPFGMLVRAFQPYLAGLYRHGDRTQIYVSRGTGYWGPPMRFGAPAEITKLILVKG